MFKPYVYVLNRSFQMLKPHFQMFHSRAEHSLPLYSSSCNHDSSYISFIVAVALYGQFAAQEGNSLQFILPQNISKLFPKLVSNCRSAHILEFDTFTIQTNPTDFCIGLAPLSVFLVTQPNIKSLCSFVYKRGSKNQPPEILIC